LPSHFAPPDPLYAAKRNLTLLKPPPPAKAHAFERPFPPFPEAQEQAQTLAAPDEAPQRGFSAKFSLTFENCYRH